MRIRQQASQKLATLSNMDEFEKSGTGKLRLTALIGDVTNSSLKARQVSE